MMVVWLVAIPLIAAFVGLALPQRLAKLWAVVASLVEVAVFAALLWGPRTGINVPWVAAWGIRFHLGVDGLSLFLLGLTAVMTAVSILASKTDMGRAYFFWILFLEFGTMGLFTALDLFLFYIFWEVILIPVFFLLTGWSGPRGRGAATKWLVMNLVGSLFMLVGIVAVAIVHAEITGHLTFEFSQLGALAAGGTTPWIFAAFFLAFAIKAPLWPLHGWMPAAYGEAPPPVTALIAGVLSKAGIYGLLRVLLPIFGPSLRDYQSGLMVLAAVGLVWGAAVALRQSDMKMVAAYASLSHMGMMALGVFSLTRAGIEGATFLMVAHGLMVGGLFIVMGLLEDRTHARRIQSMGGLNRATPRLAAYFLFFSLATLGLPGLPGFAGEYMVIQGLVRSQMAYAIVAVVVLTVAAWYMLRVFQGIMQGPVATTSERPAVLDLGGRELAFIVPLAALVVLLGVWPAAFTLHAVPSLYHAVRLAAAQGGIG